MFRAESKRESSRAICRPDASGWVLVIAVVAFSILLLTLRSGGPHAPSDTECIILVGLLCIAPSLWLAAWLVRARIEATEDGLRWRGIGRWRTAAWSDVTDYYERFLPQGKKDAVIETLVGKVRFAGGVWKDSPTLRASVERNVVHARTWGIIGLRPEQDWPRTFGYETRENRMATIWMSAGLLLLAGFWVWLFIPKLIRTYGMPEWIWNVAGAALSSLVLLSKGALFWLALRAARDTKRHFGESIIVTQEGITFRDGPCFIAAKWAEVTEYRVLSRTSWNFLTRYRIKTTKGTFEFVQTLDELRILCLAIEQHAIAAHQMGWQIPEEELLGGRNARWSSGCEGVGERVFHYRSRSIRAMLWLPTALLIATSLLAVSGLTHLDRPFSLVIGILTFWGWMRYFRASVRIGEGLTQHTIFGPRKLAWSEIEDFYLSGEDVSKFGNVTGAGKRIRFWIGINDVEELKREIARHAIHSRSHTWELRAKETHKAQTLTRQ